MHDCCSLPVDSSSCKRCGGRGQAVLRKTMESLLKPAALGRMTEGPYYFDHTPDCDVVYFRNQDDSYFVKDDLMVRVGLKETEPPVPICYCFGHTAESAREEILLTGRSTVGESIAKEIQAGNCRCEFKNPSGKCCLGEVTKTVNNILRQLRPEPAAERKG